MSTPRLIIHTHTDLIEVLPLLTGYQPTDSLVALYLNTTGQADKAARIDLSLDPRHLARTLDTLLQQCHTPTGEAGSVHLVAYSDDTHTADHTLLFIADNWTKINNTSADNDTALGMLASASSNNWAPINPANPTPPTHRQPYPNETSVLAADAVLAGAFREYQTRDELAATIAAPDPTTAAQFVAQVDQTTQTDGSDTTNAEATRAARQITEWMQNWITNGYPAVNDQEAAELTAAVQHIDARDTAWVHISTADARHHLDMWRSIARRIDGPHALPILGLTGAAAWINGNGTLVNAVLDRAHTITGSRDYTMLGLLEQIITAGMPPTAWAAIRADLADELRKRS